MLVIKVAFEAAYLLLWYPVHSSFGYRMFHSVGADMRLQGALRAAAARCLARSPAPAAAMYRNFAIVLSLLKADFVVGVLLVLMSWFFFVMVTSELVVLLVALSVTLLLAFVCWSAVAGESAPGIVLFFLLTPVQPAFIVRPLARAAVPPPRPLTTRAGVQAGATVQAACREAAARRHALAVCHRRYDRRIPRPADPATHCSPNHHAAAWQAAPPSS